MLAFRCRLNLNFSQVFHALKGTFRALGRRRGRGLRRPSRHRVQPFARGAAAELLAEAGDVRQAGQAGLRGALPGPEVRLRRPVVGRPDRHPDVAARPDGADGRREGDRVSANMLYRMAQYHEAADEIGAAAARTAKPSREAGVRSLRSAIKGFYHHGACLASVWPDDDGGSQAGVAGRGAGGRRRAAVPRRLLYVADTAQPLPRGAPRQRHHPGGGARSTTAGKPRRWPRRPRRVAPGTIPWKGRRGKPDDLHAFLIVGYTRDGFLVLNSWGEEWGGVQPPKDWRDPASARDRSGEAGPQGHRPLDLRRLGGERGRRLGDATGRAGARTPSATAPTSTASGSG